MKVVKIGRFVEADGGMLMKDFEFDAEGGPVDVDEMWRLAKKAAMEVGRAEPIHENGSNLCAAWYPCIHEREAVAKRYAK